MPHKNPEDRKRWEKEYHRQNKERRYKQRAEHKAELRVWLNKLKNHLGCSICGEKRAACLDFHHLHHLDPKTKRHAVAHLVGRNWKQERILEEVRKCVVICANCHRVEHVDNKLVDGATGEILKREEVEVEPTNE